MVKTSRNETLELYRTVEGKRGELATAKSNLKYIKIIRNVAGTGAVGFGGATAYLYDGEMHIGLAAIGMSGLLMAAYVYDAVKVIRAEKNRVSDLEKEINTLVQNPVYQVLLKER